MSSYRYLDFEKNSVVNCSRSGPALVDKLEEDAVEMSTRVLRTLFHVEVKEYFPYRRFHCTDSVDSPVPVIEGGLLELRFGQKGFCFYIEKIIHHLLLV